MKYALIIAAALALVASPADGLERPLSPHAKPPPPAYDVQVKGLVIENIAKDLDETIENEDVLLVEDIVDTGKTLHEFLPQLIHQQPASLKIVALLHKPAATVYPLKVDYKGFEIPDKFVVGYGLDYNGLGRNTAAIYQLSE